MSCQCGHCHSDHGSHYEHHHEKNVGRKEMILRAAVSTALLLLGLFLPMPSWVQLILMALSWLAVGYPVAREAIRHLFRGQLFDEMFLMTAASVGAFCLGEFFEGVAVMLLYQIGEFFQDYAVDKSRDSIGELMDIRSETANLERDGGVETVSPETVQIGDILLIRPGEKVPLDGVILEGETLLDTGALTGESMPRPAAAGDQVISGCVNLQGAIRVRVTHSYENSTVSRILELAEHSAAHKSRTDRFITRFARVYTPAVVYLALALAVLPPLVGLGAWRTWMETALTFLVISCPCALVISVPLAFFAGIGAASRKGILMKGANYLELLARADTAVFDKTGTLTLGVFKTSGVQAIGMEEDRLLALAASAESMSNHPIARSLRESAHQLLPVKDAEEIPGMGIRARVDGLWVAVGNEKLMEREQAACRAAAQEGTWVHVAVNGVYAGAIEISDALKPGAGEALRELQGLGVEKTVLLTGDGPKAAEAMAARVGIAKVYSGLLPQDKVEKLETLLNEQKENGALIYVGDGINDAPVLARADVGVAMGALGSDAAIEAADVVLMDDDPGKLPQAIRLARRTLGIVRQNIAFSLGVKGLVMILGMLRLVPLWAAVFADVGVCLLAIFNAMRAAADKKEIF